MIIGRRVQEKYSQSVGPIVTSTFAARGASTPRFKSPKSFNLSSSNGWHPESVKLTDRSVLGALSPVRISPIGASILDRRENGCLFIAT